LWRFLAEMSNTMLRQSEEKAVSCVTDFGDDGLGYKHPATGKSQTGEQFHAW
jgi:hypothetical protein